MRISFGITRTYYEQFDCTVSAVNSTGEHYSEAQRKYKEAYPDAHKHSTADLVEESWEIICDECGDVIHRNEDLRVCDGRIVCPRCRKRICDTRPTSTIDARKTPTDHMMDMICEYNIMIALNKKDAAAKLQEKIEASIEMLHAFGVSHALKQDASNGNRYTHAVFDGVVHTI